MIHAVMVLWLFAATPPATAPLPAQYLKDGTFTSPDGWFAVHMPEGSEWLEMRAFDGDADPRWPDDAHQSVAWYVRGPKTPGGVLVMERYVAVGAPELNASYVDGLEDDVRKALKPHESIADFSAEVVTWPVEGVRYSYLKTWSDGTKRYEFWYVTGWQHKVSLHVSGPTNSEPKWFRGIVQSFRWIKMP